MNHPNENALLLLAYGESPAEQVTAIESHVAVCETCRAVFAHYEHARVALDDAIPAVPRRRASSDCSAARSDGRPGRRGPAATGPPPRA